MIADAVRNEQENDNTNRFYPVWSDTSFVCAYLSTRKNRVIPAQNTNKLKHMSITKTYWGMSIMSAKITKTSARSTILRS